MRSLRDIAPIEVNGCNVPVDHRRLWCGAGSGGLWLQYLGSDGAMERYAGATYPAPTFDVQLDVIPESGLAFINSRRDRNEVARRFIRVYGGTPYLMGERMVL
jgi:hypothetical protein